MHNAVTNDTVSVSDVIKDFVFKAKYQSQWQGDQSLSQGQGLT